MIDLRLGDCLEVMQTIPNKSIDAIICDLPYGTTACKWDSVIPFEPLWAQYKRIIKDNGAIVLFGSQPFTSALVVSNIKWFKYELIWEKSMPSGMATSAFMPMKYHENIVIFYDKKPTYNKIMAERSEAGKVRAKTPICGAYKANHVNLNQQITKQYDVEKVNPKSILKFASVPNAKGYKLHPTQKPVDLIKYIVKTYTNQGDVVLDNCMGSGTTGVACKNLGRKFIGIEQNANYFEVAKKRINE
jgi:site-specific DNA-methyltransferase (adenine-specific)